MDNISSEAIFYSSSYTTKSGWKVTFALPDDQTAKLLDEGGAGQRYMIALVPIGDDEQPKPIAKKVTTKAQMAGILCNDQQFWNFLTKVYEFQCSSPEEAAGHVRRWCNVTSRKELDTDIDRGAMWEVLRAEFDMFIGKIAAPTY